MIHNFARIGTKISWLFSSSNNIKIKKKLLLYQDHVISLKMKNVWWGFHIALRDNQLKI